MIVRELVFGQDFMIRELVLGKKSLWATNKTNY